MYFFHCVFFYEGICFFFLGLPLLRLSDIACAFVRAVSIRLLYLLMCRASCLFIHKIVWRKKIEKEVVIQSWTQHNVWARARRMSTVICIPTDAPTKRIRWEMEQAEQRSCCFPCLLYKRYHNRRRFFFLFCRSFSSAYCAHDKKNTEKYMFSCIT